MIVEAHAFVHGRVQGVFFRASTRRIARSLRITGWARNLPDGSVEIVAQGTQKELDAFFDALKKETTPAIVERIDLSFKEPGPALSDFQIL